MISGIIGTIAGLYTLVLIVNFVAKLVVKEEKSWMKALDQLCAPAVGFGKIAAKKLFGNKEFAFDMPLLMAIVLVIVASAVVCGVLGILGL